MATICGYDIGGAHLKVARVEHGRITAVRQIRCPLWEGIAQLDRAFEDAAVVIEGATHHAVTMTGELTEIFESRDAGVRAILQKVRERLAGDVKVFMGLKGFSGLDAAFRDPFSVGSANFLATAQFLARDRPHALLIDIGSTTTDIIPCERPQGLTDAERLQTGELVYTGLTRTPVASVTTRAPLAGQWQSLARDTFATMGDVRRVLGDLPDGVDLYAPASGDGDALRDSLIRFARGFGHDADIRHLKTWQASAAYISERQIRSIIDGAMQVLSRPGLGITNVVAAGIGASTAKKIAERIGLPSEDFGMVAAVPADLRNLATCCAPAVAIALLAGGESPIATTNRDRANS